MLSKKNFGLLSLNVRKTRLTIDVSSKNASQLSQTIRIASQKGVDDVQFWSSIKCRFYILYKTINSRNLSFIANGFSRAKIYDSDIWNRIVDRSYELADNLDYQDIAILSNAICKVSSLDRRIFEFYSECVKNNKDDIHWRYGSMIIYSYGRIGLKDTQLINKIVNSILPNLSEMTMISLSNMVTGLCNLNLFDRNLFTELAKIIKKRMAEYVNDRSIDSKSQSSTDDVKLNHVISIYHGIASSNVHDRGLYELIHKHIIGNYDRLKPVEMVIISNSMYKSKQHNSLLIDLMCKRILKRPELFDMDMICIYINSVCVPKFYNTDFMEKMYSYIISHRLKSPISLKNNITLLRVYSKLKLRHDEFINAVYNNILSHSHSLNQLDLANVINYLSTINSKNCDISLFLRLFVENKTRDNPQCLSRVLYSLTKLSDPTYNDYVNNFLDKILAIDTSFFEPVNVSNILYGLQKIYNMNIKSKLFKKFTEYTIENMDKFSHQLLASTLHSFTVQNHNDAQLYYTFCKNAPKLERLGNFDDNLKLLNFLNSIESHMDILTKDTYTCVIIAFDVIIQNLVKIDKYASNLESALSRTVCIINVMCNKNCDEKTMNVLNDTKTTILKCLEIDKTQVAHTVF